MYFQVFANNVNDVSNEIFYVCSVLQTDLLVFVVVKKKLCSGKFDICFSQHH